MQSAKRQKISHNNKQQYNLHIDGFVIYKNALNISDKVYSGIVNQAQKKATPIFNHNKKSARDDRKRKMCTLNHKSKYMNEFVEQSNSFLKTLSTIDGRMSTNPWVIIHSKPNCKTQAAHTDYVPSDELDSVSDELMPLSAIVCIMDKTTLDVWPKSIKYKSIKKSINRKILMMCKGDVFIFRGDLVHAGSSYDDDNYRLHCFIDSPYVPRTQNRTWIIHKHADESFAKLIIL